jgi:hypothetical protein
MTIGSVSGEYARAPSMCRQLPAAIVVALRRYAWVRASAWSYSPLTNFGGLGGVSGKNEDEDAGLGVFLAENRIQPLEQLCKRSRIVVSTSATGESPGTWGPLEARAACARTASAPGPSDSETASRLFISRKTASRHVSNVPAKLGLGNRAEAAFASRRLRNLRR